MSDAIILCGGLGTRLRSVLSDRPKALAPVAGRPFITHLLDSLVRANVTRVVLAAGYRAEALEEALGHCYGPMTLVHVREPRPLGTAGALRFAAPYIESAQVLVTNGDSFCDVDLDEFFRAHAVMRAVASLVLTFAEDAARYGKVACVEERVVAFAEKGPAGPGWINAGIYLLQTDILKRIAENETSLERQVFPRWIQEHGICAFRHRGTFIDIGTPESWNEAQSLRAFHSPAIEVPA